MLIKIAFHTGLWTLLFFILGMIKPKWPLFFMKNPDRFLILIISTVLFMAAATLYGEGNRQKALEEKALKETVSKIVDPSAAPIPVPEAPSKPNFPKN